MHSNVALVLVRILIDGIERNPKRYCELLSQLYPDGLRAEGGQEKALDTRDVLLQGHARCGLTVITEPLLTKMILRNIKKKENICRKQAG